MSTELSSAAERYPEVHLQRLEAHHLEQRTAWASSELNRPYLSYDYPLSLGRTRAWFDRINADQTRAEFAIQIDGELLAFAGLLNIDWRKRSAELHLFLSPELPRGRGYGKLVYRGLCEYAFKELSLARVYGYQHSENEAARRAVESVGWSVEGTLRCDGLYHGRLCDRHVVAILSTDWQALRDQLMPPLQVSW